MGRPQIYDPLLAERLLAHLSEDGMSLREACRLKDMPGRETVRLWLKTQPDFPGQYARACEERADSIAEKALQVVEGGGLADSQTKVSRDRLKFDAARWFLSKVAPKKYGDRVEHSGPDGGPIAHQHHVAMGTTPAAQAYREMIDGPKKG